MDTFTNTAHMETSRREMVRKEKQGERSIIGAKLCHSHHAEGSSLNNKVWTTKIPESSGIALTQMTVTYTYRHAQGLWLNKTDSQNLCILFQHVYHRMWQKICFEMGRIPEETTESYLTHNIAGIMHILSKEETDIDWIPVKYQCWVLYFTSLKIYFISYMYIFIYKS